MYPTIVEALLEMNAFFDSQGEEEIIQSKSIQEFELLTELNFQ